MRGRLASGDAKNPEILALIVGDADLFASILPDIGLKLSDDLAKEWQMAGRAIDPMPNTQQGRRNFLAAIKIVSEPSIDLGLSELIKNQLYDLSQKNN